MLNEIMHGLERFRTPTARVRVIVGYFSRPCSTFASPPVMFCSLMLMESMYVHIELLGNSVAEITGYVVFTEVFVKRLGCRKGKNAQVTPRIVAGWISLLLIVGRKFARARRMRKHWSASERRRPTDAV